MPALVQLSAAFAQCGIQEDDEEGLLHTLLTEGVVTVCEGDVETMTVLHGEVCVNPRIRAAVVGDSLQKRELVAIQAVSPPVCVCGGREGVRV